MGYHITCIYCVIILLEEPYSYFFVEEKFKFSHLYFLKYKCHYCYLCSSYSMTRVFSCIQLSTIEQTFLISLHVYLNPPWLYSTFKFHQMNLFRFNTIGHFVSGLFHVLPCPLILCIILQVPILPFYKNPSEYDSLDVAYLLYPLTKWWPFILTAFLGYNECRSNNHENAMTVQNTNFISFECIFLVVILANHSFDVLKTFHIVFLHSYVNLHFVQKCVRIPFPSYLC